jgi:hypothetical protein
MLNGAGIAFHDRPNPQLIRVVSVTETSAGRKAKNHEKRNLPQLVANSQARSARSKKAFALAIDSFDSELAGCSGSYTGLNC